VGDRVKYFDRPRYGTIVQIAHAMGCGADRAVVEWDVKERQSQRSASTAWTSLSNLRGVAVSASVTSSKGRDIFSGQSNVQDAIDGVGSASVASAKSTSMNCNVDGVCPRKRRRIRSDKSPEQLQYLQAAYHAANDNTETKNMPSRRSLEVLKAKTGLSHATILAYWRKKIASDRRGDNQRRGLARKAGKGVGASKWRENKCRRLAKTLREKYDELSCLEKRVRRLTDTIAMIDGRALQERLSE
jgi:hypothetical protein